MKRTQARGKTSTSSRAPWEGKTILVTGGTGSFGNAFAKLVLSSAKDVTLRVYSRDELKQLQMSDRLKDSRVRYLLGDVRDRSRLKRALEGVDLVVHAAALKQVPSCEYNPFEAVQTNVIGSQNVIEASIDAGVQTVLAISTDKAVNPINLYGATKLCSEKLFVSGNTYSGKRNTRFAVARYGNVVGSRGSVIPLFLKQRETGTLTITDERMTRFWITLEQAARFVQRCLTIMQGGEIFVPKIPSMRVTDLARAMAPRAKLAVVGIRPGEKLHEVLLTDHESRFGLEYDDCYILLPESQMIERPVHRSAKPVAAGHSFTSDNNPEWVTTAQLQKILSTLELT